ncbi:FAM96A [Bugula neritina]|uniref:FAM96A n=1 Tax=Bugula neritina TaxID=10212 RepID=A0A7J7JV10_BUGNE|nr:FAM96A [Bugula neritina]
MALVPEYGLVDEKPDEEIALDIYDILKGIKDPERPETLEELQVLTEESVQVKKLSKSLLHTVVTFVPTVPHCSLASLIGLCIREKLKRSLPHRIKVNIYVKEGSHSAEEDVNKQINDKERVAAALENPSLLELIDSCIEDR